MQLESEISDKWIFWNTIGHPSLNAQIVEIWWPEANQRIEGAGLDFLPVLVRIGDFEGGITEQITQLKPRISNATHGGPICDVFLLTRTV